MIGIAYEWRIEGRIGRSQCCLVAEIVVVVYVVVIGVVKVSIVVSIRVGDVIGRLGDRVRVIGEHLRIGHVRVEFTVGQTSVVVAIRAGRVVVIVIADLSNKTKN